VVVVVARATTVARRVTCPGTAPSSARTLHAAVVVVALMTGSATTVERAATCRETVPMVDVPPATRSATNVEARITCSATVLREVLAVVVVVASTLPLLAATTATRWVTSQETVQSLRRVCNCRVYSRCIKCTATECTTAAHRW